MGKTVWVSWITELIILCPKMKPASLGRAIRGLTCNGGSYMLSFHCSYDRASLYLCSVSELLLSLKSPKERNKGVNLAGLRTVLSLTSLSLCSLPVHSLHFFHKKSIQANCFFFSGIKQGSSFYYQGIPSDYFKLLTI